MLSTEVILQTKSAVPNKWNLQTFFYSDSYNYTVTEIA